MKKIGVIYNPFAGQNRGKGEKRIKKLQKILGDRGILRVTRSQNDIESVAREFYRENIDILAISGGDGTNQCVLTKFTEIYQGKKLPILALLRGGTMNLLETSLGMKGNPVKRLARVVKQTANGECPIIEHTLLKVNNRLGFIFGNGAVSNVMEEYYRMGAGPRPAMYILLKSCWDILTGRKYLKKLFSPIKADVQVGDKVLPEQSFVALMAATERECGLGFKPFYRAREQQGKLHFLAVNMSPKEIFKNLPNMRTGKKLRSNDLHDFVTDRVVINTHRPYYYTVDGEMLNSTTRIEVSSGPIAEVVAV